MLACEHDSSLVASACDAGCSVRVLAADGGSSSSSAPCCRLAAPVAHLRWAPARSRPLLLVADVMGALALCRRADDRSFVCAYRLPATDALVALEWLASHPLAPAAGLAAPVSAALPFGCEGFLGVGACGALVLHWRPSYGADQADRAVAERHSPPPPTEAARMPEAAGPAAAAQEGLAGWARASGALGESQLRRAAVCSGAAYGGGLLVACTSVCRPAEVCVFAVGLGPSAAELRAASTLRAAPLVRLAPRACASHLAFLPCADGMRGGGEAGGGWVELLVLTEARGGGPAGVQLWRAGRQAGAKAEQDGPPAEEGGAPAGGAPRRAAAPPALAGWDGLGWARVFRLSPGHGAPVEPLPPPRVLSMSADCRVALVGHAPSPAHPRGPWSVLRLGGGGAPCLSPLPTEGAARGARKRARGSLAAHGAQRGAEWHVAPGGVLRASVDAEGGLTLRPMHERSGDGEARSSPWAGVAGAAAAAAEGLGLEGEASHGEAARVCVRRVAAERWRDPSAAHPWDVAAALSAMEGRAAAEAAVPIAAALDGRIRALEARAAPPAPLAGGAAAVKEEEEPAAAEADAAASAVSVARARYEAQLAYEGPRAAALLGRIWEVTAAAGEKEAGEAGEAAARQLAASWRAHLALWVAADAVAEAAAAAGLQPAPPASAADPAPGAAGGGEAGWRSSVEALLGPSSLLSTIRPLRLAPLAARSSQLLVLLLAWARAPPPPDEASALGATCLARPPPPLGPVLPVAMAVLCAARARLGGGTGGTAGPPALRGCDAPHGWDGGAAAPAASQLKSVLNALAEADSDGRAIRAAVAAAAGALGSQTEWELECVAQELEAARPGQPPRGAASRATDSARRGSRASAMPRAMLAWAAGAGTESADAIFSR